MDVVDGVFVQVVVAVVVVGVLVVAVVFVQAWLPSRSARHLTQPGPMGMWWCTADVGVEGAASLASRRWWFSQGQLFSVNVCGMWMAPRHARAAHVATGEQASPVSPVPGHEGCRRNQGPHIGARASVAKWREESMSMSVAGRFVVVETGMLDGAKVERIRSHRRRRRRRRRTRTRRTRTRANRQAGSLTSRISGVEAWIMSAKGI